MTQRKATDRLELLEWKRLTIPMCGVRLVDTPDKIEEIKPTDGTPYSIDSVFMTIDEWENLPEYDG